MAILHDTAICLRCWDFSETSQTVSLLTREPGIIRGLAKGSRRDKGCFSGGFDPVHIGHVRMILAAGEYGEVIVVANCDSWLFRKKGFVFMSWDQRKEY